MPPPQDSIQVENVVASTEISQELDLETLAEDLPGTEYNPEQFPGLVYRTQEPKAALLIFRSGKIVVTGAHSKDDIRQALTQLYEQFSELGLPVPDEPDPTVQNMVSSADLGQTLNLNAIAIGFGLENVEYEPEQFPGLVYRLNDPDVVVLLFGSGKAVITGARKHEDATEAIAEIRSRLTDLGMIE